MATQAGKYHLLRKALQVAPFFGLFSRIHGQKLLEHETRRRIFEAVQAQPGIHFRQIMDELGLANGVLVHHLHKLEQEGLVKRRQHGTRMRFYPVDAPMHQVEVLGDKEAVVLRYVQRNPGTTMADMGRALGAPRQSLHYHIQNLRERGLLVGYKQGRTVRLALAAETAIRLSRCRSCREVHLWQRPPDPAAICVACKGSVTAFSGSPEPAAAAG